MTIKTISRFLFISGFAIFLYNLIKASSGGPLAIDNPIFPWGWIMIVLGVVTHLFSSPPSDFWGGKGQRVIASGWGIGAIGIILESHPLLSNVMIVVGFLLFGIGLLIVMPTFKS